MPKRSRSPQELRQSNLLEDDMSSRYVAELTVGGDSRVEQQVQELQRPWPLLQRVSTSPPQRIAQCLYTRSEVVRNEANVR